jgi:hypothetical protein
MTTEACGAPPATIELQRRLAAVVGSTLVAHDLHSDLSTMKGSRIGSREGMIVLRLA